VLEPFGRLTADERQALDVEAERLAAFIGPREPTVYARFRNSGARRRHGSWS
jgi:hypothetical protein